MTEDERHAELVEVLSDIASCVANCGDALERIAATLAEARADLIAQGAQELYDPAKPLRDAE